MPDPRETPAMQQYYRFKRQHPGCVLLFRMGDFYETFDEDAVTIARALGLTLTKRTEGLPMAGVPYHQLENYLRRLIQQGFRVAVADQLQDPKEAKGIVDRGVTRVVTPGTLVDDALLDGDAATTLAAVAFLESGESSRAGVAFVDASTGEFLVAECAGDQIADELARRSVGEVIYAANADGAMPARMERAARVLGVSTTGRPAWQFRRDEAVALLKEHFAVATLAGFGLSEDDPAVSAAGAALAYLKETQAGIEDEEHRRRNVVGSIGPRGASGPATERIAEAVAGVSSKGSAEQARLKARRLALAHLRPPRKEDSSGRCVIDAVSLRSLEVERTIRGVGKIGGGSRESVGDGTLVGLFLGPGSGCCRTAMGKRLLREWICQPLGTREAIESRQRAVATFVDDRVLSERLRSTLERVQDVARIAGRVALGRATPRDVVALGDSLSSIGELLDLTSGVASLSPHRAMLERVRADVEPLASRILATCVDAPPAHLREGGLFKPGVDAELDESRQLQADAGSWLAAYQERLIAKFDLPSLKVGFNKIHGYFIELPSAQARRAPEELTRTQTLKNAERYTTPELRDFERKATTAEARAIEREKQLFEDLCLSAHAIVTRLSEFARGVAELDALQGLAERAARKSWVRPVIVDEPVLSIHGGRHPVLEEVLGSRFVPNDTELGVTGLGVTGLGVTGLGVTGLGVDGQAAAVPACVGDESAAARLALITGPNMAGKSTYIRQVALLSLLAHVGSFVPADRATIGLCDRIFTRIGADDALHAGQSTFMVEMTETANILNHVTGRSLVILDEIGRGTSTLDGLSLAWGITEFLAGGPRTLFATHYHELTDLADRMPARVRNLHVAVREWPSASDPGHDEIIFLHRILPGRTDQSYGIHVARLAGLPRSVIDRAREVLGSLTVHHHGLAASRAGDRSATSEHATEEDSTDGGGSRFGATAAGRTSIVNASAVPPTKGERSSAGSTGQMSLFTEYLEHPALDAVRELKLESLSPMQAFDSLRRIKEMAEANGRA